MKNDLQPNTAPRPQRRRLLAWRIVAWVAGACVGLCLLAVIAVAILLHNQRFHEHLLGTVQKQASESLGVRVQLQNFAVNLSHLSLDVYGITVGGAAPYESTPLLQVDHAEMGIGVVSVLHRRWYLDSFQVDRPVVRVFVDASGRSNLPTLKSGGNNSSNTSVFDLEIRHAVLGRGEVYYNNRQAALAADLHEVDFQASFDALLQRYSGRLAYSDGQLVSGSLSPIPHDLEAEFDATRTTFHLSRCALSSGPSHLLINATLQTYASPVIDARYDATVDGDQLGEILQSSSIPSGVIRAAGSLHYRQVAGRSPLESVMLKGDLSSARLNLRTATLRTRVTNLAAHYSLESGDVAMEDFRVNLLGGRLTGSGVMKNVGGNSSSKVSARLDGISLADIRRLAGTQPESGGVSLDGTLNAQLAASWGRTLNDLVAHTDAAAHGHLLSRSAAGAVQSVGGGPTAIPIESAIHGTYTAVNKQIALKDSYVRMPQTSMTMNGLVSDRSSLGVRLQADDLREMEVVANLFRAPVAGQPAQSMGLAGSASFEGNVQGSASAPHLTGQLVASDFHVYGSAWKVLRAQVEASPSLVSLQRGDLEAATRGHITFDAKAGLNKWSFNDRSPVQAELTASQMNIADLARLTGQKLPVSGTIEADIHLHGTELNPVGSGSVSVSSLVAYDQPVNSAKLTFSGTGDEAHADLTVQLSAGSVLSTVSVRPKEKTYSAQLDATGIRLEKLQALTARNIKAAGEVSLHANGHGSFDNPQLGATLQIPQLVVENETVTGLKLQMNMADHVADASLATSAVNTNIQAKAKIELSGDYVTDATLDTQAIPFEPLLAAFAPEQAANITGQTEIHATLHGPLKNKNLIEAHVKIPTLKMAYGNTVQLAAAEPIQIDYKNGVVVLQRATIRGTDTDLQMQASMPVGGAAAGRAPLFAKLLGTVNLQLAQLFDSDVRSSGELKVDIHSDGMADGTDIGGQINIVDAAFASGDLPVGLTHGNGVLTLTRDRLTISSFQGSISGGTITARGGATFQPKVQFDVGLAAQGIRMLYPQGVRESVEANLRLSGSTDAAILGGSVNLTDLSFTPAFDLTSVINQFSGGIETPPTPGFSQNLQLNVAVRSTSDINLVSRTLSVGGSANLQVRGTASTPVILGRVNLNSGDIILNGNRFVLNGGTIAFVNPSETEPVVNLSLQTTIQQYDIFLRFNGPAEQLRTNYSSNPSLPSADIINLLAFGQTTEASAQANTTTTTNQAAESLVASQVSSQVTSRVSKIAGISQLSINPVLASGTAQGPAGANITIQQRVTSNLFVTFSSNAASTQSQTIQGQYQISPRVALSATRDPNGGFAVDALIKKTW